MKPITFKRDFNPLTLFCVTLSLDEETFKTSAKRTSAGPTTDALCVADETNTIIMGHGTLTFHFSVSC